MTSRKEIYEKYFNSNIFNTNTASTGSITPAHIRISQSSLACTKNDIFNIDKKPIKESQVKTNRLGVYSKIYGSDIFCQSPKNENKKKDGVRKIRNANNFSNCMEGMKNNEEYKKNLKNYSKAHRAEKKEYNPDKYMLKESAAERYYKEIYDPHGSSVLPGRNFSAGPENKQIYAEKKKSFKKQLIKYNDSAADSKKNPGENEGQNEEKKIFVKKKYDWNDKNEHHYVESNLNPKINSKINKQLNLQSHIFQNNEKANQNENNPNLNIEKINLRIEEQKKSKVEKDENYNLGNEEQKRDLSNNDRSLWGSVHTKWENSNLDWKDSKTEIMFGTGLPKDVNNNFGPNGPNAFQRKLNNLADTKNKDTINEEKKPPINDLQKPPSEETANAVVLEKVEEALDEIPNLKEDEKYKIKMEASTSVLNPGTEWDKKTKELNKFYTNPKFKKSKSRDKPIMTKIGASGAKKEKEIEKKSGSDYSDFVLSYPTKGQFEKFEEKDIKKIFGVKGVHIYDVQKNMFDKGSYNTIKFKVRENEDEGNLKQKMDEITKDFEKQNYKVIINKDQKKDIKKNYKNLVNKPGAKLIMINENIGTGNDVKLAKSPDKIKYKNSFSKLYGQVNPGYKKK